MIELEVARHLTIKDYSGSYTRVQLSRAVGYWKNFLDTIADDPRPVGLWYGFGSTSFQTIAVLLAVINSGKDYYKFSALNDAEHATFSDGFSAIFSVGIEPDLTLKQPGVIYADSEEHRYKSLTCQYKDPLKIYFRADQYRYNKTSGSTGPSKLTKVSMEYDAYSIKCAMDAYFDKKDYCVFSHNMTHIGVHTTAILPALFKAKVISLVDFRHFKEEAARATHIQYFYTMLDKDSLPETSQIRICTTGGDYLKPQLVTALLNAGVKEIVDIYGLTEAAPPLAIRSIKSLDDTDQPFKWIHREFQCRIGNHKQIFVVFPDGSDFGTSDSGRFDSELQELTYEGRLTVDVVRFNGVWTPVVTVKEALAFESGITNYFLDHSPPFPKLFVTEKEAAAARKFINQNSLTAELVITDQIPTNGGIKTTRQ